MFQWLFKYPLQSYREGDLGLTWNLRPELLLLALALAAFGAWWLYRREARAPQGWRRWALPALRVAGTALVALALLGPVLRFSKRDEQKAIFAVAVDASTSMNVKDGASGKTRFERARAALGSEGKLAEALAEFGEVRFFTVGSQCRPVTPEQMAALQPADDQSALAQGLKELSQMLRGLPVEGVVLLTDGIETTGADPAGLARLVASRGGHVHCIGFGEAKGLPDLQIVDVRAPRSAERGSLVTMNVQVRRSNIQEPVRVRLYQDTELLKEEEVLFEPGANLADARISFVAEAEGAVKYKVELPAARDEQILDNNERIVQVDVKETRVEVLLVEGSPRHEYAFIRRAMADNKHFKVVTLLRLGKGNYYKRADDDSFLSEGFPDTAERLGRFKAVILSDIEAGYFTSEQLRLIVDFVKVRGGGLLMLGGVNAFNLGGYQNTPLADLLPVSLAPGGVGEAFDDSKFQMQVTREGAEDEILRLSGNSDENIAQWNLMPPLKGYNPLYAAKPGAAVLARHPQPGPDGRQAVLLAVQEVGAGRTGVFAAANSWRWQMLRPANDDTFRRFWSQTIRWLAAGSKEMLSVGTDTRVAGVGQNVTITATVLDRRHRPCNEAKVLARVKDGFGNVDEVRLAWILREEGVYQATFRPTHAGDYSIGVEAQVESNTLEALTSLAAIETSPELNRIDMDAALLTRIANEGKGVADLEGKTDAVIAFVREHAVKRSRMLDLVEEKELRDAPILLLLICGIWFAEWIVRRRSGMA
ncbi:MAG: hypothetical protein KIS92_05620 [Planctomycetota bacterium]|nr:hypothetical protein [Planctomycetota bacterium]